jgi:uncharacterized protein with ATP-grasp and redox domains
VEFDLECVPCTVQSCLRLVNDGSLTAPQKEDLLRRALTFLGEADWRQSPPALARELHVMLREATGDADPYLAIKERSNLAMLARADDLRKRLAAAADPFAMAVRLAVAGNVIDFGARHLFDPDDAIERVLSAELAIDHTETLRAELAGAASVLYVGDNTGEIVLDRLCLEVLDHPGMTFAVRGAPVINDATIADAAAVGIESLARVISTGDDSPGAIPARASAEFRTVLAEADVVVAKGQGNLEGLWNEERPIYYLLTVKCERVGRHLGVPVGAFVVCRQPAA